MYCNNISEPFLVRLVAPKVTTTQTPTAMAIPTTTPTAVPTVTATSILDDVGSVGGKNQKTGTDQPLSRDLLTTQTDRNQCNP